MTYRKLAQLVGVSPATVSKALSGSGEISAETAALVRRVAEEHGVVRPSYRREHTSKRVAVIVPEIVSVFYSVMATSITEILSGQGFEASIMICGFSEERFFELLDLIESEKLADGVIALLPCRIPRKRGIPVVTVGSSGNENRCDSVGGDMSSGVSDAVGHLVSLGHRHIGFIGEKNTVEKQKYFRKAIENYKLDFSERDIFVSSRRFEMIGVEGAEYFMKMRSSPTAFIAAYDEVAFGAIHTFSQHGIRVPEDVSIIGINDIPSSAFALTPLTTIKTFSSEMISIASKLLIDRIENPGSYAIQKITLGCELIIRSTTSKPKENSNENLQHY